MFTKRGSRADYVLGGIRVLTFMGVPQPKSLHRFQPNFQDMFILRGSKADKVLGGIQLPLFPWQHF